MVVFVSLVTIIKQMTKNGHFIESYDREDGAEIEVIITNIETGKKTAFKFIYEFEKILYWRIRRKTESNEKHERLIITNRCKHKAIRDYTFINNITLTV